MRLRSWILQDSRDLLERKCSTAYKDKSERKFEFKWKDYSKNKFELYP